MKVSVVLPTYNEVGNIVPLVTAILSQVAGHEAQIIVVDDASPDGTLEAIREEFAGDVRVVPMLRTSNRGLANSIRAGLDRSHGDFVIIMDTDFTHSPEEIPRMLHLLQVADVVIGSRFCPGGSMQDNAHYVCSLAYNWIIRILLRTQIQDNLSGFLGLRRSCIDKLPLDKIFWGYGDYCFRLLHYAQRNNAQMLEMPVKYLTRTKGRSKSVFWKMLVSYTVALACLRVSAWRANRGST